MILSVAKLFKVKLKFLPKSISSGEESGKSSSWPSNTFKLTALIGNFDDSGDENQKKRGKRMEQNATNNEYLYRNTSGTNICILVCSSLWICMRNMCLMSLCGYFVSTVCTPHICALDECVLWYRTHTMMNIDTHEHDSGQYSRASLPINMETLRPWHCRKKETNKNADLSLYIRRSGFRNIMNSVVIPK